MPDESHGAEWFAEEGGEPVELVRSDPSWPRRFDHIRRQLADALGPAALRIDHIGSTAIPGLEAKPVIDVQVSVARLDAEDEYRAQIESLGWELRAREPEHRFFRPAAGEPRTVHVHVCQAGGTWETAHLLFRDYLHAHPARAAEYVALKRQLVSSLGRDRAAYTRSKNPFIAETLELAAPWARDVGWRL